MVWYLPAMTDTGALHAMKQALKWFNDHEYTSLAAKGSEDLTKNNSR